MIDARFGVLREKVEDMARQFDSEAESDAELLKLYMSRRQEQAELLRSQINGAITLMGNFEQVLILRRSDFKQLNLDGLTEFLNYADELRATQTELNALTS